VFDKLQFVEASTTGYSEATTTSDSCVLRQAATSAGTDKLKFVEHFSTGEKHNG
jgi:hypothetical protein